MGEFGEYYAQHGIVPPTALPKGTQDGIIYLVQITCVEMVRIEGADSQTVIAFAGARRDYWGVWECWFSGQELVLHTSSLNSR